MRPLTTSLVFLAALLAPLCLAAIRRRRRGAPVHVSVDPDDPRPADIAGYLAEIARSLDADPRPLRVVFDGRNTAGRRIALDLDPDRRLRISVDGHRPVPIDLRGRWIADHPVPLRLHRTVLYVRPVDANRFRVGLAPSFTIPSWAYAACALAATVSLAFLQLESFAAAAGLALGCLAASRPR